MYYYYTVNCNAINCNFIKKHSAQRAFEIKQYSMNRG